MEEEIIKEDGSFLLVEFDGSTLKEFFEFSKMTGHKTIYLTSLGGSGSIMVAIADTINQAPEEYTIKLVEMNCSSSFLLCMYTQCNILEIANQYNIATSNMWHSVQFEAKFWTKQEIKDMARMDSKSFEMIQHVLTKKQVRKRKRFARWTGLFTFLQKCMNDDIYLTNEQMKELLGERYRVI